MIVPIILSIGLAGFVIWFWKKGVLLIAERYAGKILEKLLFNNDHQSKSTILQSMNTITKGKYSNEQLLDYFLKIKGLQVINKKEGLNFWTRKYLMCPTKLKLNYFEQVKFYETFLNYPEASDRQFHSKTDKSTYITSESNGVFLNEKQLA
jgi:hypothetical protein